MKKILLLSISIVFMMSVFSCNAQTAKKETAFSTSDNIEVYYFHFTARCVTCKTVEAETKANLQNLYSGEVSFQSINLDDDSSKTIAKKLKVSGQTLLIVKGNSQINITNEGFMYARTNPEKFKSIIQEKVDAL